jgi:phosphotriesterase-related protein
LKCAIDQPGLTRGVERILRAVAAAHRETGAPITVHTHAPSGTGLVVQRVLREEAVDLGRVVIGHSGDSSDLAYLTALMDAGSYVGMDRFGLDLLLPFEARVDTVAELCRRGYASRIVLSHDAACHIDWFADGVRERYHPRWHFHHIHDDVLPALRERGVTDAQMETMLVANPRDYFTMP